MDAVRSLSGAGCSFVPERWRQARFAASRGSWCQSAGATRQGESRITAKPPTDPSPDARKRPRLSAVIRGVVTCSLPNPRPSSSGLNSRDLCRRPRSGLEPTPRVGGARSRASLQGTRAVHSGRRVTALETVRCLQPIHPAWDQLINGSLDTQYVEIKASLPPFSNGVTLLRMAAQCAVIGTSRRQ
jgi:hypothetical protein